MKGLSAHVSDALETKRVTVCCPKCGKSFTGPAEGMQSNLKRHLLTHSGERPHQCNTCAASFTTTTNLKRHISAVHKPDIRSVAALSAQSDEVPLAAPAIHQGLFTCPDCEATLSGSSKLRRHLTYHCPFREDITLDRDDDPGTPVAQGAPDDFLSVLHKGGSLRKRLRPHTVAESDDGSEVEVDEDEAERRTRDVHRSLRSLYMCCVCSEVFRRRRLLRRHSERMHPEAAKTPKPAT